MEKQKINLLIVDDEVQFLSAIGRSLELRDFNVLTASNGNDALALARAHPVDIALLEQDWEKALAEFEQANQQDPIVLCLSAKAWGELGDSEKARKLVERAANFNAISFNYAFVRAKARKMLEELT